MTKNKIGEKTNSPTPGLNNNPNKAIGKGVKASGFVNILRNPL